MHPLNRVLEFVGLRLVRAERQRPATHERAQFERAVRKFGEHFEFEWTGRGLDASNTAYRVSYHARRHLCWAGYASDRIARCGRSRILDLGSSLDWVFGLSCGHDVTMVDIRDHEGARFFPFGFRVADAAELPFEDDTFDIAAFWQLLHHVGVLYGQGMDPEKDVAVLAEIRRVLRPGGLGICCTLVKAGRTLVPWGYSKIFGAGRLDEIFAAAGFEMLDRRFVSGRTFDEVPRERLAAEVDTSRLHTFYGDFALITARKPGHNPRSEA